MCRAVKCKSCGKTTWAGCGEHVAQVMAGIPAQQRCVCGDAPAADAPAAKGRGLFARLTGR